VDHVGAVEVDLHRSPDRDVDLVCAPECLAGIFAQVADFPPPLMPGHLQPDRVLRARPHRDLGKRHHHGSQQGQCGRADAGHDPGQSAARGPDVRASRQRIGRERDLLDLQRLFRERLAPLGLGSLLMFWT
jgi:hypothetical protein